MLQVLFHLYFVSLCLKIVILLEGKQAIVSDEKWSRPADTHNINFPKSVLYLNKRYDIFRIATRRIDKLTLNKIN